MSKWTGQKALKKWSWQTVNGGITPAEVQSILNLSPLYYYDFRNISIENFGQVLYKNLDLTDPVTTSGDLLGSAKNLGSGGNVPLKASSTGQRPLFSGASLGAVFDGVNDRLQITGQSLAQQYSVWINIKINIDATFGTIFSVINASNGIHFGTGENPGVYYYIIYAPSTEDESANLINTALYASVIATIGASTANFYQNGTSIFSPSSVLSTGTVFNLGLDPQNGSALSTNIKSVAFFDRVLNGSERAILDGLV